MAGDPSDGPREAERGDLLGGPRGRPHLVVLRGPGLGDFFLLNGGEAVLGSDPFHADLVVRDIAVARRHAEVRPASGGGGYVLRGLGAEDGTVAVNGAVVEGERVLGEGDRISLGDSLLEFSSDPVRASFHGELHRLVNLDYLTGLLAKNRFDDEFERRLEAARADGSPVGVVMSDIDNLKKINDAHGHLMGEFVVGEIGRLIGGLHADEGRSATRFGGDEYQSCLPGLGKEGTAKLAEEVRGRVRGHRFVHGGIEVRATLSLGVASFPEDGTTAAALTRAADAALYRAKKLGGDAVSA